MESGNALYDILAGNINPCAKLTDTIAYDYESYPSAKDFGNKEFNNYTEDIFVGYRYFETFAPEAVLYPFGFGLSYTTFKFGKARIAETADGGKALVVNVRNTGKCDGEEVVQLYISRADDSEGPIKTLRGFKRVALKAGEQAEVSIPINDETFLWWNPESGRMNPMAGEYTIHYGNTSDSKSLKTIKYRYAE
jgi:beta-glucosidase